MSLASIILACLLALVASSPACCCAVEPAAAESSCCGGEPVVGTVLDLDCGCADEAPAEVPAPDLLPAVAGGPPDLSAEASPRSALRCPRAGDFARPRWRPSCPWHAPPAERRARLVRRTL
jgi:hypothetical protein